MDMSQYMSVFIDESREHLQLLNESLLEFEKDNDNLSIVEVIFRSAHTLKGMAATMNFTRTAELTHHMENVLDLIRNKKLKSSTIIVDTLFECLDTLTLLIDEVIETGEETTDIENLSNRLEKLVKGESTEDLNEIKDSAQDTAVVSKENKIEFNEFEKQLLDEAESKKMNAYVVKIVLDDGCLLKAARTYMVFRNLEEMGEIIKSEPSAQDLEEEKFDNSFVVVVLTDKNSEEIKSSILSISEISEAIITNVKDLEKEGNKESKSSPKKSDITKNIKETDKDMMAKKEGKHINKKVVIKKTPTVRVDTNKLDKMMNLVAELVINKTRLSQISLEYDLQDLSETLAHVDRVTSDLQAVVTKVRMVPIENVFNRFPRMVRDLSKELNKEIELLIEGKETELDRTVIDEIGDPLVHLLRNSLDHGIELPEEREKAGKIRQGTILLKAEHEGNNVVITIADDGKGIDTKVIARKAVEKGFVKEEEVELMTKEEILKFIFKAGFSTMEAVTELSGRGVGMDVVKNKIEGLNGQIELSSELGGGTTTRIKLPLTLAIIEALLIKLQDEIYAIPLANIVETIDISPKDIKGVQNEEVIVLRGEVVPIINLNKTLDVPGYEKMEKETYIVVIVKIGSKKIGLIVDSLIGQQEIVIKSLGKLFTGIKGITGATVLGTGEVAIILDVLTLIQEV